MAFHQYMAYKNLLPNADELDENGLIKWDPQLWLKAAEPLKYVPGVPVHSRPEFYGIVVARQRMRLLPPSQISAQNQQLQEKVEMYQGLVDMLNVKVSTFENTQAELLRKVMEMSTELQVLRQARVDPANATQQPDGYRPQLQVTDWLMDENVVQ